MQLGKRYFSFLIYNEKGLIMKIINKALGTKATAVLIICLCILTVYSKLIFCEVLFDQKQFLSYVISICLSILILYIIYVITNIVEYVLLRTMKIIDIRYFVIYPFIFDETIRFNPVKLLYNQECIRDVFPQNIVFYYTYQSINSIRNLFLKVRRIREISLLVSLMVVATIIKYIFNENVLLEVVILYLLLYLFSFCYFGINWKGNRKVLIENNFKKYIFSGRYNRQISSKEYANYLYYLMGNNRLESNSEVALLKNIENYLYSIIYEKRVMIPVKMLKELMFIIENSKNESETLFFIKLLQTKKLIGLIGKELDDKGYLLYGLELMIEEIQKLENENIYGMADKAIERLMEYYNFLGGRKKHINWKEHFSLDINNLFSSEIEVESRIKEIINHSE